MKLSLEDKSLTPLSEGSLSNVVLLSQCHELGSTAFDTLLWRMATPMLGDFLETTLLEIDSMLKQQYLLHFSDIIMDSHKDFTALLDDLQDTRLLAIDSRFQHAYWPAFMDVMDIHEDFGRE